MGKMTERRSNLIRMGKFVLDREGALTNPHNYALTLSAILFLPLTVLPSSDGQFILLTGISKRFDNIPIGSEIPFYELTVKELDDGGQSINVVRRYENNEG